MSGITVQLVFAFLGTRVPYHITEPPTAATGSPQRSPFANTTGSSTSFSAAVPSATSSPSLGPTAPTLPYTIQHLVTLLAKTLEPLRETQQPSLHTATAAAEASATESGISAAPALPSPSSPGLHKAPLLEVFDYDSMSPLDGSATLHDECVLLVLCDLQTSTELVEALQLEWLEVYSGTHRPHQPTRPLSSFSPAGATEMAVCTTEERLRNVAHAQMALCKPVPLHMKLLEQEFTTLANTLTALAGHLQELKAADASEVQREGVAEAAESGVFRTTASGVAERFPLLVDLEPSLASVLTADTDSAHGANSEVSLHMCAQQLSVKEALLARVTKQLAKLKQLAFDEQQRGRDFSEGEPMQALLAHLQSAEQARDEAEEIVKCFQAEMARQLKSVRFIVAHITHLRGIVKKTMREVGAIELVLTGLSMQLQRPQLLERAEALLRRRVVLRRAARRQLLLLQETEYADLQRDLHAFNQLSEVQKVLPAKVRWYLRAPLPSLQPAEDVVATLLDQALIDRDVDAAQELVERTTIATPHLSSDAAEATQQLTDALLPVERLVRRAESAEAEAAAYKARVAELEAKVKELEATKEASSMSSDAAERETVAGSGAEGAS